MLTKFKSRGRYAIIASALLVVGSTGCRSGKSSANLFGFNSEPSAEALAGSGPTTTYPAPPSASATPEAIASIAGGTAQPSTKPVTAGVPDTKIASAVSAPSYVTPASSSGANMSAAQANGIYGKTQPAGFAAPNWNTPATRNSGAVTASASVPKMNLPDIKIPDINVPKIKVPKVSAAGITMPSAGNGSNYAASIPSGYQFGATKPATSAIAPSASMTTPSAYSLPSSTAANSQTKTTAPSTEATAISFPTIDTGPAAKASTTASANVAAGGSSDANATWPGSVNTNTASTVAQTSGNTSPADSSQPEARVSSAGTYMPGSTSSTGYPGASDGYPTSSTSGSYLR
ncbi:hypothetical protein [Planctomycetes bacterium K23_9]|uniref:Uncharacterized protein n=1 Tax=Stieleria marina TaxID=1930275 RepID=A0A517NYV9_9BACT|nr:hypothetical protein K239x_43100 [Planctomycetes bacterium K23_9]